MAQQDSTTNHNYNKSDEPRPGSAHSPSNQQLNYQHYTQQPHQNYAHLPFDYSFQQHPPLQQQAMMYQPEPSPTYNTWSNQVQAPTWLIGSAHASTSAHEWTTAYNHSQPLPTLVPPPSLGPAPGAAAVASMVGVGQAAAQNSLSATARLKPFIEKLYHILSQPSLFRDCLVWDEGGTSFIVSHANRRLLQQVLPDAFGHSNLHSFTRQLNIYGFQRCTSAELLSKLDVT